MATLESIHEACIRVEKKLDKMDESGTRICIKNSERIESNRQRIGAIIKVLIVSAGGGGARVIKLIGTGAGQ